MWHGGGIHRPREEEGAQKTAKGQITRAPNKKGEAVTDWAKQWGHKKGEPSEAASRIWIFNNATFAVWSYRRNPSTNSRGGIWEGNAHGVIRKIAQKTEWGTVCI